MTLGPEQQERKLVSVLFADLVDFTEHAERLDPEDVVALLRPYHRAARAEIERHGGTVEKFAGDAVMAVFGAPAAHEDDAERAVRAALAIVDAIARLNTARPERLLAVRVGVETGDAIVDLSARPDLGESFVAGDVVNTASRLQHIAPVNAVVAGERTVRATKHLVEYEPLEPAAVKGKAGLLQVWKVASIRLQEDSLERSAPLIGRDADLVLLRQMFERTVREASVQLVTITGEPGIGKTRLVTELRDSLESGDDAFVWRQGRCLPYGEGITFWALGEIVKAEAGILESDGPDDAAEKIARAVAAAIDDDSEHDWVAARLAALVGAGAADSSTADRAESFTAWRRFLEAIAGRAPLVLAVEDVHWADTALLEFLDHLVDWSSGVPILVVCTARPEFFELQPAWGGGNRNTTTIGLSPLTEEETSRLVSALLSQAVLPAEIQLALMDRAGGNPLYAEEFVRMLADQGVLERRDGLVRVAADADVSVPETIQGLIAARVDSLPLGRKALLHDAAVIGKTFWTGAVASMSGLDESDVRNGLHDLARKEFVHAIRKSSVHGQEEYSFWHVLVRDVAYGQIPRAARARKHEAAAAWIEGISNERVTDHAELLAHHYLRALELASAAGTGEDAARFEGPAVRFLALAGDRTLPLDVRKAEEYYGQALERLPAGHRERASVLAKAAEAAWLSGRFEGAEQRYRDAIAEFRDQAEVVRAGEMMVRLSLMLRDRGDTTQAQSLLADAVALLEPEPAGPERILAYTHVARDHMFSGRFREGLEWSKKAIAVAEELGLEGHAMRALQSHGVCRCDLGDLDGIDDLREALRLGLELGLADETAVAYINLGDCLWVAEGPISALETYRDGIDFDSRRGMTFRAMWTRAESTWALFDLGEWDELLRVTDEVTAWERLHGGVQVGLRAMPYKAEVLLHRGHVHEASSLQETLLPLARSIGDPEVFIPAIVVSALVAEAEGRRAAAVELIEEFELRTRDRFFQRHLHVTPATRISAAAGRLDLARRLLDDPAFSSRARCSLLAGRAVVAEVDDASERAAELYTQAAAHWHEYGHVLERGYASLGAGRCLARLGRWDDANLRLDEARVAFEALGAGALAAEAEEWLARAEV